MQDRICYFYFYFDDDDDDGEVISSPWNTSPVRAGAGQLRYLIYADFPLVGHMTTTECHGGRREKGIVMECNQIIVLVWVDYFID